MEKINMLELRLITDNIARFGGFREKDILEDLVKIELKMNTEEHKVYRFMNSENRYFEYDFKSHKIVG